MQPNKAKKRCGNIIEAIGHTPLVRLNKLTQGLESEVWVKCEFMNPAGSVKERIGYYILQRAFEAGILKPGATIVENTSGNTGAGLALYAAVNGYKCVFTMPDKMSQEKIDLLKAFGARVVVTPTNVPHDSPQSYYEVAKRIAKETPGSYYVNQYENKWNVEAHYTNTGPEIWDQTDGQMTHFVVGLGTCGTFTGCSKFFKEQSKSVKCVGVDPEGSVFYNYWKTGELGEAFVYKVEGIGKDLLVGIMDFSLIDEIVKIGDKDSFIAARSMARDEGIFAGGSAGTAVAGALEIARKAPKGSVIVVILPDSGARYASKFYNDEWMRDNQFLEYEVKLGYVKDLVSKRKPHEIYSVSKDDLVGDVITQLRAHGISQMPVYGENGKMLGIINEADLLQFMVSDIGSANSVIEPIMQTKFPSVKEDTPLDEVSGIFKVGHDAVMVERAGGNADILTKIDLIEYLAARAAQSNGKH